MKFNRKVLAARAALGWTRDDLAKRSGLSAQGIIAIEKGNTSPTERSKEMLLLAFKSNGIVFTEDGIEEKTIQTLLVDDYMQVLDDIEKTLSEGGELLFHCSDDRRSSDEVLAKLRVLSEKGFRFRSTISEDNDFVTGDMRDYRRIPAAYHANSDVVVIYGDKIAIHAGGANFMIIYSKTMSDVFRRQFEYWWKQGSKIGEK